MNKKRITREEWTFIGKYNHSAKWCRPFCTYTLLRQDDKTIVREQKVNLLAYLIMFIPLHFLQIIVLVWDGGLKEFEIFKRMLGKDVLSKGSSSYDKAEVVLAGGIIEKEF
jgi:hypothetical protein